MCACVHMTLLFGTRVGLQFSPGLGTLTSILVPYLLLLFCPLLNVGHNLITLSVQPTGVFGH